MSNFRCLLVVWKCEWIFIWIKLGKVFLYSNFVGKVSRNLVEKWTNRWRCYMRLLTLFLFDTRGKNYQRDLTFLTQNQRQKLQNALKIFSFALWIGTKRVNYLKKNAQEILLLCQKNITLIPIHFISINFIEHL